MTWWREPWKPAGLVLFYTSFVKNAVKIPVIPKMTPNITSMGSVAMSAFYAKADAVSAINTIKSITKSPLAEVNGKRTVSGYSGKAVKPIALRFINEISQSLRYTNHNMEISGIGGIGLAKRIPINSSTCSRPKYTEDKLS